MTTITDEKTGEATHTDHHHYIKVLCLGYHQPESYGSDKPTLQFRFKVLGAFIDPRNDAERAEQERVAATITDPDAKREEGRIIAFAANTKNKEMQTRNKAGMIYRMRVRIDLDGVGGWYTDTTKLLEVLDNDKEREAIMLASRASKLASEAKAKSATIASDTGMDSTLRYLRVEYQKLGDYRARTLFELAVLDSLRRRPK